MLGDIRYQFRDGKNQDPETSHDLFTIVWLLCDMEWHCLCLCKGLLKGQQVAGKFSLFFRSFSHQMEASRNCERTHTHKRRRRNLLYSKHSLIWFIRILCILEVISYFFSHFIHEADFYGVKFFFCSILSVLQKYFKYSGFEFSVYKYLTCMYFNISLWEMPSLLIKHKECNIRF